MEWNRWRGKIGSSSEWGLRLELRRYLAAAFGRIRIVIDLRRRRSPLEVGNAAAVTGDSKGHLASRRARFGVTTQTVEITLSMDKQFTRAAGLVNHRSSNHSWTRVRLQPTVSVHFFSFLFFFLYFLHSLINAATVRKHERPYHSSSFNEKWGKKTFF